MEVPHVGLAATPGPSPHSWSAHWRQPLRLLGREWRPGEPQRIARLPVSICSLLDAPLTYWTRGLQAWLQVAQAPLQ